MTQEQALNYDEVRKKLNQGIQLLQTTVSEFLTRITESRDLIPYGLLYISKVLNDTLKEKFPDAPEKDILKVVGNLIYYHFINAAIVAPDAYEIINLPVEKSLSNDQRRNLASIAKILQFAASKKGVSFYLQLLKKSENMDFNRTVRFSVWRRGHASHLPQSIYNRVSREIQEVLPLLLPS